MKQRIIALFSALLICLALSGIGFADDKDGKVNLNTATKEQLVSAGIDTEIADGILELREENGEFVDMEELLDVEGVDPRIFRQLKQKTYIEATDGCNC